MTSEVHERLRSLVQSHEVWQVTPEVVDLAQEVSTYLSKYGQITPLMCKDKIVFDNLGTPKKLRIEFYKDRTEVNTEAVKGVLLLPLESTLDSIKKMLGDC